MPATDQGSTRSVPLPLLIAAGVLVTARIVLAILEPRTPSPVATIQRGGGPNAIHWREPGVGEAEAASTGRPVLYDFTADWCPPCRVMQREVFGDTGLARRLETVAVPVKVLDRQREEGRNPPAVSALQQQFRISAFPTLVVYEPQTGKFEQLEGYPGAAKTRAWMLEKPVAIAASPSPAPLPAPGGR